MNNYLKRIYFYIEPSTLKNKLLRDNNTFFINLLLSKKGNTFINLNCFSFTILFPKTSTYKDTWSNIEHIITQLNKFFENQAESLFFIYSVEMHRTKKNSFSKTSSVDKLLKNIDSFNQNTNLFSEIQKKHNLLFSWEQGELVLLYDENSNSENKKLTGLPHIHCFIGFNFFKQIYFNNITLQDELIKLFPHLILDIKVNFLNNHIITLSNSFNYILKNLHDWDTSFNLNYYSKIINTKSIILYNESLYNDFKSKFNDYKTLLSISITYLPKNTFFTLFYQQKTKIHLCANEFLFFLLNNNTYKLTKDLNGWYKLVPFSQITYKLFKKDSFEAFLRYCLNQKYILDPFFNDIFLNTKKLKQLIYLILDKLYESNYSFFEYIGFEFKDIFFNTKTGILSPINKSIHVSFRFFDFTWKDFISSINFNNFQLNPFFYANNLSLDFCYYLGFLLHHLSNPNESLLKVHLYIFGSSGSGKSTFINNLLESLFGSKDEVIANIGFSEGLKGFQSFFADKNLLYYNDFTFENHTFPTVLKNLSNTYKFKEIKFENTKIVKSNPAAIFTSNQSPIVEVRIHSINRHSQFLQKNPISFDHSLNSKNILLGVHDHKFFSILQSLKYPHASYYSLLPAVIQKRISNLDSSLRREINSDAIINYKDFLLKENTNEHSAILRRLILFDILVPSSSFYNTSQLFSNVCFQELPIFFIFSSLLTFHSFSNFFPNSNIKDYVSDDFFKLLYNHFFNFGIIHPYYSTIQKSEVSYDTLIPHIYRNISYSICYRLEHPNNCEFLESILRTYITNYPSNSKQQLDRFIGEKRNDLPHPNPNIINLD